MANVSTNQSLLLSNDTGSDLGVDGKYAFLSIIGIISLFTILYNTLIILAFVTDARLRTPFNLFLLNLSVCDLFMALFSMTGAIGYELDFYKTFGYPYCSWYLFLDRLSGVTASHTMMMISFDRLWCLIFPHTYRNYRSAKMTVVTCAVIWGFVIALLGPYILMDRLWYADWTTPCGPNTDAQRGYTLVIEFAGYDLPPMLTIVAYSFIFWRLHKRKNVLHPTRTGPDLPQPASSGGRPTSEVQITQPSGARKSLTVSQPGPSASGATGVTGATADTGGALSRHFRKQEAKLFRLFSLLAVCLAVCWFPAIGYFLAVDFRDNYWDERMFSVVATLQYSSCLFNPVIYHSSLPDLQQAITKLFGNLRCKQ